MVTRAAIAFVLLVALLSPHGGSAAPVSPLVTGGAAQYLALDWREARTDGRILVSGTVRNVSDWGAKRIQLLVEGLDQSGQILDQCVLWLGTDLPPGRQVYFETPGFERAAGHRVRVFAFESSQRL